MDEVILRVHYPRGKMPVRGFRCRVCGDESLLMSEAAKADEIARDLGLFGLEQVSERKLLQAGNSIAVTLDPLLVQQLLGGAKPGTAVRVGRLGNKIVVEAM